MKGILFWQTVSRPNRRVVTALLLVGAFTFGGTIAARADDGPKLIKPRVIMKVWQLWHTWNPTTKKFQDNATSWMPDLKFSVEGPVPSGSQFSVDFTKPNGVAWMSFDIPTDEVAAGEWETFRTPRASSAADEKKYTNGVGVFGFKIRLKNELTGSNKVLFTGKYKVAKQSNFNGTPVTKNQYDYYVDHDWALPIAYLYAMDEARRPLAAALWFKGQAYSNDLAGYLFYNGKQIGSTKDQGSAGTTEEELNTVNNDKGDPTWQRTRFVWFNISDAPEDADDPNPALFYLNKNPGEYELKVLRNGKLSRQAKFTVGADGKLVDNGLDKSNQLNFSRYVLPVKILGTTDGTWVKTAWQTGAFYGNPLKGFIAP